MLEILRRDCEIESEILGALNGFWSWRVKKTLFLACAERSGILGIGKMASSVIPLLVLGTSTLVGVKCRGMDWSDRRCRAHE